MIHDHVSNHQVQGDISYYCCLVMTGDLDNNLILEVWVKVEMKEEYGNGSVSYPGSNTKESRTWRGVGRGEAFRL